MSINHAVLLLEDLVVILDNCGMDKFYTDQLIDAINTVIDALPDEIKNNIDREGIYTS